jgi:iron(III) transport system permease protein
MNLMRRKLTPSTWFWLVVLTVFFGLFLVYPLLDAVRVALFPEGKFSLKFFGLFFQSPLMMECLWNSFKLGIVVTLATTVLTLPLAHLFTRYGFRGKALLSGLLLVPMIMPPFVGAIGMRQFFSRYGSVNLLLMKLGVMDEANPIDWFGGGGFWGVVILAVLHLYPIMFLNVSAAMANIDPTLREAAENLGARGWRLFRTVTLPLVMPGFFAAASIVFIWAFTDLGTPLMLNYSRVIPVQIFDRVKEGIDPMGYALVLMVMLFTAVLFMLSKWAVGSKRYEMLARGHATGGETQATRAQTLGIYAVTLGLIFLAMLPHISVILQSFSQKWFFTVLPNEVTLGNYAEVVHHELAVSSIRNSLLYSSLSAVVDLVLGVVIAWLITRKDIPGKNLLDTVAMLPLAIPGLVIAFGYVGAFNVPSDWPWLRSFLNPRENPTLLLVVSYSVRRLPYIVRAAVAGFQQTSVTLEEASLNLGASPFRTLRKITVPLVMANLIAGTILTFSFAMLEVSDSLILAMTQRFYPITKAIYELMGRISPDAPAIACAMGVIGMALLTASLLIASKVLGKKMGQLFRV